MTASSGDLSSSQPPGDHGDSPLADTGVPLASAVRDDHPLGVATRGTVRVWHDDEGWGVVDSPEAPGGCWVGFGQAAVPGYRALRPGQEVELECEAAHRDGYAYRALRVWPTGAEPVETPAGPPGAAYTSTLTLTFDADGPR